MIFMAFCETQYHGDSYSRIEVNERVAFILMISHINAEEYWINVPCIVNQAWRNQGYLELLPVIMKSSLAWAYNKQHLLQDSLHEFYYQKVQISR